MILLESCKLVKIGVDYGIVWGKWKVGNIELRVVVAYILRKVVLFWLVCTCEIFYIVYLSGDIFSVIGIISRNSRGTDPCLSYSYRSRKEVLFFSLS